MSDSASEKDGIGQGKIQAGHLWIVLPLIFSAMLTQSFLRMGLPALYPFIQIDFGLSRVQVGLITSMYAAGTLATALLAGWLTDYLGVKRVLVITLLSVTAFTLAFPLAHAFPVVLGLAALIGAVSSPIYPATTRSIMDWFPVRFLGSTLSVVATAIPVGGAITAAILPTLALLMGWRMAAAAPGLIVLVIAIAFILFYRDYHVDRDTVRKFNFASLQTILRNRALVVTIIWGTVFLGLHYVMLTYIMLFLIEELRFSAIMAGGMLAIVQVSSSVSRILWGAASDFVFHGRRAVLAMMGFLTVTWMLGASLVTIEVSNTTVYLVAIIIGMSISFHGVNTALTGELAGAGQVGFTIGVASMAHHAGMLVLPPLFGFLVDVSDSYSLAWRVAAGVALASTLALLAFVREPKRQ